MKIQAQGAMRYVSDFGVWIWKLRKTKKKKNYYNNSDNDKTNAFESLKIRAPSKVKLSKRTFWFILIFCVLPLRILFLFLSFLKAIF